MMQTYPYLVQYNNQDQIVPDFATSWSHSANGLTWTFKVHANAKWSDGKPLTAADVAWTINNNVKYQTGGTATFGANVFDVVSADAPNPTTVVIHYSHPFAEVLPLLGDDMPILPEHIWDRIPPGKNGVGLQRVANKPPSVAGGPYVPVQWNGTTFLLLKANPYYYGPKPLTPEVGLQYFTSTDGLLLALKDHQIDYANGLPPADISVVKKDGLKTNIYSSTGILTLSVNDMPASPAPALRNILVRRAIDLAIDRQQIVSVAYPGGQSAESELFPANGVYYNNSIKPQYNVALANKLLDQAGYKMGPGGVRVANGKKMAYTLIIGTDTGGEGARAAQIIQTDLARVGISLTLRFLDPTTWFTTIYGNNGKYNTFDMGLEISTAIIDPSLNFNGLTCRGLGTFNVAGYCNPQMDALYAKQSQALSLPARIKLIDQAAELAYKTEASIQIVYVPTVDAHQPGWTGFGSDPYGSLNSLGKIPFVSIHHV
jgi:peptide/nickel transport system substrate-binding protein